MESVINNKKLAFLERSIHLSMYTLSKQMLLIRVYKYYFHNEQYKSTMRGYIPDIFAILSQYELTEYMHDYVTGGAFPNKQQWLGVRKVALRAHEIEMWSPKNACKNRLAIGCLGDRMYYISWQRTMSRRNHVYDIRQNWLPFPN